MALTAWYLGSSVSGESIEEEAARSHAGCAAALRCAAARSHAGCEEAARSQGGTLGDHEKIRTREAIENLRGATQAEPRP